MNVDVPVLLVLDLTGVFAFAVNGALTAIKVARIDIIGVLTLGVITALGGGIVRDLMIGDVPPATFEDWRYLAVAAAGSLLAFAWGTRLDRLSRSITVLDAAGLSLFAVTGALKALDAGLGPVQAILLGGLTGVGGGTIRDMMLQRVPTVLQAELYAIPALLGATIVVLLHDVGAGVVVMGIGAAACFALRMVGVAKGLHAPVPREFRGGPEA